MLEKEEMKRRLAGLRALRGYTQQQLQLELEKSGLNKTELGKVERGERLSDAMRAQLVRILRAPEAYFLEPDLDKVLFRTPDRPPAPTGELGRDLQDGDPSPEGPGSSEPPEGPDAPGDSA